MLNSLSNLLIFLNDCTFAAFSLSRHTATSRGHFVSNFLRTLRNSAQMNAPEAIKLNAA
jgi:hypothetical protein